MHHRFGESKESNHRLLFAGGRLSVVGPEGRAPPAGAGFIAHKIEFGDLYWQDERRVGAGHSLIDPTRRSHDFANLWICDNSIFQSARRLSTLTVMALSLRTAEAFLRR